MKVPGKLNVRREPGHGARALADGDVGAGHEHSWADHDTFGDRVAQGDIIESAIDAHVAHGGELGVKCDARVGNDGVSTFDRGFLQHKERLGVAQIGQVGVAIEQSRQHGHFRKIDHCCACGNGQILAHRFNFAAAQEKHLTRQHLAHIHVHEPSRANYGNLRR